MKKIYFLALFTIFGLLAVSTSCDKISEPYMNTGGGGPVGDTIRKILLEDFTGHTCVNCPGAHLIIEGLQIVYKDRIVVVVNHVGYFAKPKPAPYDYDFRTLVGKEIAVQYGADQLAPPKGMVNRKKYGGYLLDPTAYAAAVSLAIDSMPELPEVFIELTPSYKSSDSTISVEAKMTVLSSLPAGKYNISLLVVESNIIKPQKNIIPEINNGKDIMDYNHKDVLRGAINTTWGEEFANTALSPGQTFTKTYTNYKIGSDWKPDDLKIVAIVAYADGPNDKVVIQADEAHLK